MKLPDKIYLTPLMLFAAPQVSNSENDVEYIRTDAFIEKACEWMRENVNKYLYNTGGRNEYIPTCSTKMVEDFANYMKGE